MIDFPSLVAGFIAAIGVLYTIANEKRSPVKWPLVCPICGFEHVDTAQGVEERLRPPKPASASCATCKADITYVWLEDPNVQRILKKRDEMRVKNAAAHLKLEALMEYETEMAAAKAAKEKA